MYYVCKLRIRLALSVSSNMLLCGVASTYKSSRHYSKYVPKKKMLKQSLILSLCVRKGDLSNIQKCCNLKRAHSSFIVSLICTKLSLQYKSVILILDTRRQHEVRWQNNRIEEKNFVPNEKILRYKLNLKCLLCSILYLYG